jgi:uncharacterized membrane protein
VSYAIQLFERYNLAGAWRWLHVIAGITWIGLLYYFNLVQVPAFAKMDVSARNDAIDKVARRALWWFRWGALATVIFGLLITSQKDYFEDFFKRPTGLSIFTGMILGLLMFVNVWGVIWRKQKVVLANAANALAGKEPVPGAADAGRRALLASRQNFIFSVPMVWFMVGTSHFYTLGFAAEVSSGKVAGYLIVTLLIIAVLEINALGVLGTKQGTATLWPYENHRNAIISAFVLWAILWLISELFFAA